MEIKLATWINAGERCTNQEEYIELKIFAPAILESKYPYLGDLHLSSSRVSPRY
jgi:hypothetical protein